MAVYDVNGNNIGGGGGGGSASVFIPDESPSFYDKICKSVNHRGWTGGGAVENSLAAFKASKTNGFYYVETDVRHTSDGIAVLYHDDNISDTAVNSMTYAQVLEAVPTIAKFDDFITLCRKICLHPYIELKQGTKTQIQALVDVVWANQMRHQVTWFGGNNYVSYIQEKDADARLGILSYTITSSIVSQASALKLDTNEVFLDTWISNVSSDVITMAKNAGLPLEAFTFSSGNSVASEVLAMDSYITGFTAGDRIAGKILYDANIS